MERRRDYRHRFGYPLRVTRTPGSEIIEDSRTVDVSASGLRLQADRPHGLRRGQQVIVELFAPLSSPGTKGSLHLATDAIVVRVKDRSAALRFHAPFAY